MSYRVEAATSNRATCQATHCKKEGTKILKGSLRHGAVVTFGEHTSMKWRHWGCVTPQVLANWKKSSEGDMELIDGYDTLVPEHQEKVKRALDQLHVDDEDWNGDVEMNRHNPDKPNQGMFLKTPKKKANDSENDESEASPAKKQGAKKRSRAKKDDEDDEVEPAPKKAKGGRKKAAKTDDEDQPTPAPPAKKARKTKKANDEAAKDAAPEPTPAASKGRGRKTKSAAIVVSDEDEAPAAEEAPPKKARAKKGTAKPVKAADHEEAAPKSKPQKRQRGKKAAASADD